VNITQKCQYGLRAAYELARRAGQGPVKIADIAEAQAIPARFLEAILCQLKLAGFLASKRGSEGGYMLARRPEEISVGELMRCIQGSMAPVSCVMGGSREKCRLYGDCPFLPMWKRAHEAMLGVYDATTLSDLVRGNGNSDAACYSI